MDTVIRERIKLWTENPYFSEETRREVLDIKDPKELEERFCCELEFGTAGIRGILGAGTNRLNIYWIRRVIQGLAEVIKEAGEDAPRRGVVIAYDCRRCSPEFAREAALVLAANGIKAYLFDGLRPTPELSFAVRYLGTVAGIMITASHNPKEYNGCKVYWEDGGQVPPGKANKIVAKLQERDSWEVTVAREEAAREQGLLVTVGAEIDRAHLEEIKKHLLNRELAAKKGSALKLVFTPLHGTGNKPVRQLLQELGFTSLAVVSEQAEPDPEFSTVKVPNPEEREAFALALGYAQKTGGELILATDPDADRLGVLVRDKDGSYRGLTGNQLGVVLLYYLLSQLRQQGTLPPDGVVMKSIASTDLAEVIAADFEVPLINVPVGFKYIGEQIKLMEERGKGTFLFGFEESNGYLAGTYARDKDAVQAAALTAEAALYYKETEGKTLLDVLRHLYDTYDYYLDEQVAVSFPGLEGKEKIGRIMANLRQFSEKSVGGLPLEKVEDYLVGKGRYVADGTDYSLTLPLANVLRFSFEGGGYVMARPSGTEPKIRIYFCVRGKTEEAANSNLEQVKKDFLNTAYKTIEIL